MKPIDDATLAAWAAKALENPPDRLSWVTLIGDLRVAAELGRYDKGEADNARGLAAAQRALHAVFAFLQKQQAIPLSDLQPVANLYGALFDLNDGRVDPMFVLPKKRRANGINYESAKGTAARAMDLLMEREQEQWEHEQPAQAIVLSRLRGTTFGKTLGKDTVKYWRNKLNEGEGARGVSGIALYAYRRPLPSELGSSPREQAESLLRDLRETC